jgi:hypothetical protein
MAALQPQPVASHRQIALQPSAGNAFQVPAGFTLRPPGMGQRLPDLVQRKMESFFGADFSGVRIHVGPEAPSIGALAFTVGSDVYFAPGHFNLSSQYGQRLLGHELTHVVQQRSGRVRNPFKYGVAVVQDAALEAEAERMGVQAASSTPAPPVQAKMSGAGPRGAASITQIRSANGGQSVTHVQRSLIVGAGGVPLAARRPRAEVSQQPAGMTLFQGSNVGRNKLVSDAFSRTGTGTVLQRVVKVRGITLGPNDVSKYANDTYNYWIEQLKKQPPDISAELLKKRLNRWVASKPWEVPGSNLKFGSLLPALGVPDSQPKAYWKSFNDNESFYKQLIYDTDPAVSAKRKHERKLASQVLQHEKTKKTLNSLRRALGQYLWSQDSITGKLSYYVTTSPLLNWLPNMTGSYNESNSYPAYETKPPNDIRHGHSAQLVDRYKIVSALADYVYRRKDRLSLLFDSRDFTVAENIAILHDVKELFSPKFNNRALPTFHKELIPHPYQGSQSPTAPQRWDYGANGTEQRVGVKTRDLKELGDIKKIVEANPGAEIKWDQGRLGTGTRNEESPDTVTARKKQMPIETGRSHTAARLFEMVSLLKDQAGFDERIRALAIGIFGYWNAKQGGYARSLTPVHTYHEVMDPAEDYLKGVYNKPFTYENIEQYLTTK